MLLGNEVNNERKGDSESKMQLSEVMYGGIIPVTKKVRRHEIHYILSIFCFS